MARDCPECIAPGTICGDLITEVVSSQKCRKVLETGSHTGRGTSTCVLKGLWESGVKNPAHIGIELSIQRCWEALLGVQVQDLGRGIVEFVCGCSIPESWIPDEDEVRRVCQEAYDAGYYTFASNLESAVSSFTRECSKSAVSGKLPDDLISFAFRQLSHPDCIILDSAGSIGYLEFKRVMELAKESFVLILDDTESVKHWLSMKAIASDSRFTTMFSLPDERRGFHVARFVPK